MRKSVFVLMLIATSTFLLYGYNVNAIGQVYTLEVSDNEIFAYKLIENASSSIYSRFIMLSQEDIILNTNNYTARNATFQTYVDNVWQNHSRFLLPNDPFLTVVPVADGYLGAFNSSGIAPEIGYPFILPSVALITLDQLIENLQNKYAEHNMTVDIVQNVNKLVIGYDTNQTTNMTLEWDTTNGVMTYFDYVSSINGTSYHYRLSYIQKPIVEKSADITFTRGSTGNVLVWNIYVAEIFFIHYDLYIDDNLSYAVTLTPSQFNDDNTISIGGNFDNLLNGSYAIRFVVSDGFGYSIETTNTILVNPASDEPDSAPYIVAATIIVIIAVVFVFIAIRSRRQKNVSIRPEVRDLCLKKPNDPYCVSLRNQGKL